MIKSSIFRYVSHHRQVKRVSRSIERNTLLLFFSRELCLSFALSQTTYNLIIHLFLLKLSFPLPYKIYQISVNIQKKKKNFPSTYTTILQFLFHGLVLDFRIIDKDTTAIWTNLIAFFTVFSNTSNAVTTQVGNTKHSVFSFLIFLI